MEPKLDLDAIKREAIIACETYYNFSMEGIKKLLNDRASDLDGIAPLAAFVSDRVETSLLLLKLGKLWDAEIVFRTVLEVFAKFLIIIRTKSEEELKEKLDEFWIHLNEIEKLRQSQEAIRIIEGGSVRNPERFEYMVLSDEERTKLELLYPNQRRKVMRENWSFNKIYLNLVKDKDIEMFVPIELIHFFWKMSSHLAHGDKIGVNTIVLRGKLTELKPHNDLTQLMKLAKTATAINIWVYAELASFLAETTEINNAINMHHELGEFMTTRHQLVLDEGYIIEDEFVRKQQQS